MTKEADEFLAAADRIQRIQVRPVFCDDAGVCTVVPVERANLWSVYGWLDLSETVRWLSDADTYDAAAAQAEAIAVKLFGLLDAFRRLDLRMSDRPLAASGSLSGKQR